MNIKDPELGEAANKNHISALRRQAEKLIALGRSSSLHNSVEKTSLEATNRLLHDLQVHQIELEIQNEELRKTQLQLEESRDSYSNLFEFSPIGYLTLDSNLVVSKANLTAAKLLGGDKSKLVGRTLSRFIAAADADKFYFHCRKVQASGRRETCDVQLANAAGAVLHVQLHSILLRAEVTGEETFQIALSDITERQQAQEALQRAREVLEDRVRERTEELEKANRTLIAADNRFRMLVDAAPESMLIIDSTGNVILVNTELERMFGYAQDEVVGQSAEMLMPERYRDKHLVDRTQFAVTPTPRIMGAGMDIYGLRKDGSEFPVEIMLGPLESHEGPLIAAFIRDISDRKAASERQNTLLGELDHRVKNALSVVLSIAKQTLRTTYDFETFSNAFEGRLMALARVHRLLTRNHWGAVLLADLVDVAVRPYISSEGPSVTVTGPPVNLWPSDAQAIHLIFHELATNAAKYGAFAVPQGRLCVCWDAKDREDGQVGVHLSWREANGPEVKEPKKRGFGHEVIERTIAGSLNGSVEQKFLPAGFSWDAEFLLPKAVADSIGRAS